MALPARYDPERELFPLLSGFRRDFDRLFGDLFRMSPMGGEEMGSPSFDVVETENGFELEAELPGIRPEEVKIELTGNTLSIQAEASREEGDERRRSRERRSFYRSITLPQSIDASKIQARLEHGVLTLALPRSEQAKPRSIQVTSARELEGQQPRVEQKKEGQKAAEPTRGEEQKGKKTA